LRKIEYGKIVLDQRKGQHKHEVNNNKTQRLALPDFSKPSEKKLFFSMFLFLGFAALIFSDTSGKFGY